MRVSFRHDLLRGVCIVLALWTAEGASAMPLREAVERAVATNPEIGEAVANREATEFELDQGRGGYLPSIDLEARAGALLRDSATTRAIGREDKVAAERSVGIVMRQLLFDGFETRAEVEHQASRVDAASFRVLERSETIALAVIREYLDLIRLHRVVASTRENVSYHEQLVGRIAEEQEIRVLNLHGWSGEEGRRKGLASQEMLAQALPPRRAAKGLSGDQSRRGWSLK